LLISTALKNTAPGLYVQFVHLRALRNQRGEKFRMRILIYHFGSAACSSV